MKNTTNWDLSPIAKKLDNTEHYFDILRLKDGLLNIPMYKNIESYFSFSNQPSPFEYLVPI